MAVQNPHEVESTVTSGPAPAPPDTEAPTVELIGRVVDRRAVWAWNATEMAVIPEPPDPWTWAAVDRRAEVAPPPPPAASTFAAPAIAPSSTDEWAPLTAPVVAVEAIATPAPARRTIPSALLLLVVAVLAVGAALTTTSPTAAAIVLGFAAVLVGVAVVARLGRG